MITVKSLVQKATIFLNIALFVLLLISPFLSSGDWTWDLGWLYSGSMIVYTIISRLVALSLHPGLARERINASAMRDSKNWDKWIVPLIALWLPIVSVVIAGLDNRFGWTFPMPAWVHGIGFALLCIGYAVGSWAMAANAFFSSHVRIQKDRGQRVVTSGPYALVRHPAYITGAMAMCGIPLLLDSILAFPPIVLLCIGIVVRTSLEDKLLKKELPGYTQYCNKVRFRLFPGIW